MKDVNDGVSARVTKLSDAWLAGSTLRWHVHPYLSDTMDRVGGHSNRVAVLVLTLFPESSSDLVKAAVIHDLGEAMVGDLAYPVKRRHPELNDILEDLEDEAIQSMGLKFPTLTVSEIAQLKFCDRIDAYLWALLHKSQMVESHPEWIQMKDHILLLASELEVLDEVITLIEEISNGHF